MTARILRSAFARLGRVARRDARIARLQRRLARSRAELEASYDRPSFRRYVLADRRLARHLVAIDPSDRGQVVTKKLTNYAFAASHGVDVPQLHGVWDDPLEIDWDSLPDEVVIKANGGSTSHGVLPLRRTPGGWTVVSTGQVVTPTDVVDRLRERVAEKRARGPFFAEELLRAGDADALPVDVKVYAFYGEVSHVLLRRVRAHGDPSSSAFRIVFPDGSDAGPAITGLTYDESIPVPPNLGDLCDTAARLSLHVPRPHVRVDLYDIDGRIVFGELTPRPGNPMDYEPALDEAIGHRWERAQARLLNDVYDGAGLALRYGPHRAG